MQFNQQKELFEPAGIELSTHLVNLDQWCTAANDDSVECFLKANLQSMASGRASELHIEQEEEFCRVRLRINGRLTEQKIHNPSFADKLLQTIGKESQSALLLNEAANADFGVLNIPIQINGEKADLTLRHYRAASGKCVTLSLSVANTLPEVLEHTRLDTDAKREIRHLYSSKARSGVTLICSQSDDLLHSLLYALLGEVNSIDRKIVSLQNNVVKKVPRVSQIQTAIRAHSTPLFDELQTLISATTHRSDHIFIDPVISCNQGVIEALQPTSAITVLWQGDASTALLELFSTNKIYNNLHTIIELEDAKLICPHCADDYKLNKFDYKRLPETAPINTSESYLFAQGCNRCDDTGVSSLSTVVCICNGTDAIREAVLNRSRQAAEQAIASAQGTTSIAARMEVLARTGKISFEDWINQR